MEREAEVEEQRAAAQHTRRKKGRHDVATKYPAGT
jgi:hypothetical protein